MPIFEYQCKACGATSEIIELGSANGGATCCTRCGGTELEKKPSVISTPRMPARPAGKTCCGRDEKCGGGTSCCGS